MNSMWTMLLRPFRTGGAVLCFHSVTTAALPAEGAAHVPVETFTSLVGARACSVKSCRSASWSVVTTRPQHVGDDSGDLRRRLCRPANGAQRWIARQAIPITVFVVANAAATGARY